MEPGAANYPYPEPKKIESMSSNPTSWRSSLILSSHLRLGFLDKDLNITKTRYIFSHLQNWHICISYNIMAHFYVFIQCGLQNDFVHINKTS